VSLRGRSAVYPDERQQALLVAAVLEGEAARAAWSRWRAQSVLDEIDDASYRLLPQVYRNLVSLGEEDPWLGRLRGIYRYHWYRNQLLARTAAGALVPLEQAGIPTLVLKGAALARLHYGSIGARPMQDVDILVPRPRATEAMRALRAAGFTDEEASPDSRLDVLHGAGFNAPDGAGVDLHWHALSQPARDDDDLWARSVPLELGGAATRALGPADQLVHVCVHGSIWNALAPIRWVADSLMVLRSSGDHVDWDGLVASARGRGCTLTLAAALDYLRTGLGAPVPERVVTELSRSPTSRVERCAYRVAHRPAPSVGRSATLIFDRYVRLRALGELPPGTSFVRFLARSRGLDHPRQLPGHAVRKLREYRRDEVTSTSRRVPAGGRLAP
jgi:hypothetical protein